MATSELSCSPPRSPPSDLARPRSSKARSRSDSMEHNDPPQPRRSEAGGADPHSASRETGGANPRDAPREAGGIDPRDALRRLEERLDRASNAAERLIAEAAAEAAARAAGGPPHAGWQAAGDAETADSELLAQVVRSLRELIPPELQR